MNDVPTTQGEHFTAAALGSLDDLYTHVFVLPGTSLKAEGKVFLKRMLGLTSAEISVNRLPGHAAFSFDHKHRRNEEIYLFLRGAGEFQVDETKFAVTEGSVVRVAPDGARWLRNTAAEPLFYVVIQAKAGSYGEGEAASDGYVASWRQSV